MPRVSVIMNCLNGEPYLRRTLEAVSAQSYRDWEIVFWDDSSIDGTAAIARAFGPRLRYFLGDGAAVGLGEKRNLAAARAEGEFIVHLDHDDVWRENFLEKQTALLDANPRCGLAYADAYRFDEKGRILSRFSDGVRFHRGACFLELLREGFIAPASGVLMRRAAFEEAGGFRKDIQICTDFDIHLKIAHRHEVDFSPEPLLYYRVHAGNISRNVPVIVREELETLRYWIAREPSLFVRHGGLLRFQEFRLHAKLAAYELSRGCLRPFWKNVGRMALTAAAEPALLGPALRALALRRVLPAFRPYAAARVPWAEPR